MLGKANVWQKTTKKCLHWRLILQDKVTPTWANWLDWKLSISVWMNWCFNKTLLQMCLGRRWTMQAASHYGEHAALGQPEQWEDGEHRSCQSLWGARRTGPARAMITFLSNNRLNEQINWTCPACAVPSTDGSCVGLQKTPGSDAECGRKCLQHTNKWTKLHSVAVFVAASKNVMWIHYIKMSHWRIFCWVENRYGIREKMKTNIYRWYDTVDNTYKKGLLLDQVRYDQLSEVPRLEFATFIAQVPTVAAAAQGHKSAQVATTVASSLNGWNSSHFYALPGWISDQ